MAVTLNTVAGRMVYRRPAKKEYFCDTESDVAQLPMNCAPGSTAKVIETGNVYMADSTGKWVHQPQADQGDGPGTGGEVTEDDVVTDEEAQDVIDSVFGN